MNEDTSQGRQDSLDLDSPSRLRARRNPKIENLTDPYSRRGRGAVRAGLRLKGQWLARAGFRPGERVAVILIEPGLMHLRVIPESAQRAEALPQQTELVLQSARHPALLARNTNED